ncbi:MAG: hypothetical protein IJ274_04745 [Lachnospiraceae bacterium]|nr:hypothetical protein [Lachnospiraceae bacterium]
MERPNKSKILVPGVTLKRTEEAGLPSLMVVKVWFLWSILMILPVMRQAEVGRLISIKYLFFGWFTILYAVIGEKFRKLTACPNI